MKDVVPKWERPYRANRTSPDHRPGYSCSALRPLFVSGNGKIVTRILFCLCLWGITTGGRCASPVATATDPDLMAEEYLYEVVRHLYRWHLDESDAERIVGKTDIAFWVKNLPVDLDPGDHSRFGEVVMPDLGVRVTVKKADYTIEELNLTVKTDAYKLINVARGGIPADAAGYDIVTTSYQALRDYGHRTRSEARFPDDALLARMRAAARNQLRKHVAHQGREFPTEAQPVHLAPVSPIANEAWIFWEGGRVLVRYASDIDLENEAVWGQEDLAVDIYDIDEQTVVSLDEVAGSNAYLTRDQVGRTLFNCIVLGRRLMLEPQPADVSPEVMNATP